MARASSGGGTPPNSGGNPYPQYVQVNPGGPPGINPQWAYWNIQHYQNPYGAGYTENIPPPVSTIDQSHATSERSDQGPTVTNAVEKGPDGNYYVVTRENGTAVSATQLAPGDPRIPQTSTSQGSQYNPFGSSSSGGMTAYEAAQIELDKQKLANAQAQQKADEEYRQAQALDAFNKNFQDFQTKNYYGSIAGPAYAAPAGAPNWWKLPEPDFVANYYKNNPNAGSDPWNQPNPYSGYSGSLFSNPQQPGTQQTPPTGALPATGASSQGQAVAGPFPGVTSGALPTYNPNTPQSGQNVLGGTPPPIAPPVKGMAIGGQTAATQLAVVHGGEQVVEPKTIGATSIPMPAKRPTPSFVGPTYNPGYSIPGMADGGTIGGTVPGPPGQPQLAALPAGTDVIPGGNFSPKNPSPVANAGPESMNPIIKQLLGAVNAIITSPEFQSAVYTKPPLPGDMGSGDDSTPPGLASGWPPPAGTYDPNTYRPGSVPGTWMDVATGIPVSQAQVSAAGLPTAQPFIGPTSTGGAGGGGNLPSKPSPLPVGSGLGGTPAPIAAQQSGVVAGPAAVNHVPYGPELTGMSGFGGLITPNGTPVVASEWQRQHLDPTSISRYENYAGSIAGVNPADLKQQSDLMTGLLNENSPTIKPPIRFDLSNQIPVPGQGGG